MPIILEKNWWSLVLRGFTAILLGFVTLIWRRMPIEIVGLIVAAYLLIDGMLALAGTLRAAESHQRWGVLIAEGVVDVSTAVLLLARPMLSAFSVLYVIAAWALVTGILEFAAALRVRRRVAGELLLALSAVASLTLGIVIVAVPLAGGLPPELWIGAYGLIFGALMVALGFRLQRYVIPQRNPAPGGHWQVR